MADKRAEKGRLRLSDANPIYQGPNKYGSLQLHVKAMCHSQVATAREKLVFILHSDNAPNKQIFNSMPNFRQSQPFAGSQTLQYCFHAWFFGRPSRISDLQYYLHL